MTTTEADDKEGGGGGEGGVQDLLCKLALLSLKDLSEDVPRKTGPPADGEVKAVLKELVRSHFSDETSIIGNGGTGGDVAKVQDFIKTMISAKPGDECRERDVTNCLVFLKAVAETQPNLKKSPSQEKNEFGESKVAGFKDTFWTDVTYPMLPEIYTFFSTVCLQYCHRKLGDAIMTSSGDDHEVIARGGFAHHHLLGVLQKGLRTLLVFLKKDISSKDCRSAEIRSESLIAVEDLGNKLCEFLDESMDVSLDIRCNMGLALVYISVLKLNGRWDEFERLCERIFRHREDSTPNCITNFPDPFFDEICRLAAQKDLNRISIAVGVLNCLNSQETLNFTGLMFMIGQNILGIDHGSKETTSLGAARILEMWTEKLAQETTPVNSLLEMSALFGQLEFFVFSYIPGHIDAVKNCSRNILGFLTKVYARLALQSALQLNINYFEELLKKVLSQPTHVKFIAMSCVVKNSPLSTKFLKIQPDLPISLLCSQRTCKNAAIETYTNLMLYEYSTRSIADWETRWIKPLFETQSRQNNESNWSQKRTIVFSILNSDKISSSLHVMIQPILKFVVDKMNSSSDSKSEADNETLGYAEATLLAAEVIKIASELSLQTEARGSPGEDSFKGLLPRSILYSWFWHENPQIRLAGFSLLVDTRKSSELITKEDFSSLKIIMKYNLVSQNPAFRQQFTAYFKKLLKRLKDSLALIRRQRDSENESNYKEFFVWLWKFLADDEGLFIGANFGRRCQALECLVELLNVFNDFSMFGVQSDDDNLRYINWLSDSYENNKIRALEILEKMPLPGFQHESVCDSLYQESLSLCQSVRPPDSVSGRYLMVLLMKKAKLHNVEKYSTWNILTSLLSTLEETYVLIQKTSLTEVSSQRPMYGIIRCIQMILNSTDDFCKKPEPYKVFIAKLLDLYLKFDEVLFPVLGAPAPEGFLPGLPDSSEENTLVIRSLAAQMLLVCSWRSMRDIGLTLADMCVLFPLEGEKQNSKKCSPCNGYILSFDQVSQIGEHLLYLMRNLMHRGVFEQIFLGFKTLSTRLWKSNCAKLCSLPEKWLQQAMDEEHMSSKCITRRSAGLPFIFQALLSAESDNESLISKWVQRLFIKDESPEYCVVRIHAMNVLRGLFKDANFSRAIMPFVPDGLRIAFRGLKSEDWTERNAGLMLYGAVIRRTFGPNMNLMSAPTFFRKFPQMYEFLLGELEVCLAVLRKQISQSSEGCSNVTSDFTFHLLLLLSSFAPLGRVEDDHFPLSEFIPRLRQCAASPDIEVRKLAAKAILPFLINPEEKRKLAMSIIQDISPLSFNRVTRNHLHGCLLQVATISAGIQNPEASHDVIKCLFTLLNCSEFSNIKSPTIFEAIANILLAVQNFSISKESQTLFTKVYSCYEKLCPFRSLKWRHHLPGLPVADGYMYRTKILYEWQTFPNKFRETTYEWLLSNNTSVGLMCALTEELLENCRYEMFNEINDEGSSLLISLIQRYMLEKIDFIGQSIIELNFLKLLTKIRSKALQRSILSEDDCNLYSKLTDRLFSICTGNSATTEHKKMALITLSRIIFFCQIGITSEKINTLTDIFVEWSNSTCDDDLRISVALSIPEISMNMIASIPVINQCQVWLTILKLAQDDELEIRAIINSKLPDYKTNPACDRKSLERLVDVFFSKVFEPHPLECLIVIIGLLLRDDYQISTEEADDEEEGRLFDKSEMNMYGESVILSRIVTKAVSLLPNKNFTNYLEQQLSRPQINLYEAASNSKLFFSNPSLTIILDILNKKLTLETEDISVDRFRLTTSVTQQSFMHCIIGQAINKAFQIQ